MEKLQNNMIKRYKEYIKEGLTYNLKDANFLIYYVIDDGRDSELEEVYEFLFSKGITFPGNETNFYSDDFYAKLVFIDLVKMVITYSDRYVFRFDEEEIYNFTKNNTANIQSGHEVYVLKDFDDLKKYFEPVNINNYFKRQNIYESLLDKLVGPNKEDVWKSFGYDKSFDTPTDFINYILDNVKQKNFKNHSNSTFLVKDNKILFEISYFEQRIYVEYFDVWRILKDLFHLSILDIDTLIEDNLLKRKYYINNYYINHYSNLVNSRWWFNKKNHRDYKKDTEN